MLKIGFCNLKGGVGKTSTCQNLAVALTRIGKKVAVVDMDPQSNLTIGFGIEVAEAQPHLLDYLNGEVDWDNVVVSTREGVDVIPSTLDLVLMEIASEGQIVSDNLLRDKLSILKSDRYDYIFCDSPPQLGVFTRNVLAAVDQLFVPLEGGFFALAGLRLLNQVVELFQKRLNTNLKIGGIIMSRYNPNVYMQREVFNAVKDYFGDIFFDTFIRQNVSLVEASSTGTSVFSYAPNSNAADDYSRAAVEFVSRFRNEV